MSSLRFVPGIVSLALIAATAAVHSQEYPNKPVRVLTSDVGGSTDFAARIIAQELAPRLGQPVIVENRPAGMMGVIGPKASPDGYTMVIAGETLWIATFMQTMPYDPVRDFAAITSALTSPNVLVVTPSLPVKSVKDLIDLAKAKKGDLDYGAASVGGSAHLAGELFKSMAGVNMVRIPHKGTGDLLTSMLNGQVQLAFVTISGATPHIKSGKLRGVAVTSSRPSALLPGLPTVAETLPGYQSGGDVVVLAPPKTPTAIINRLNRETVRLLNTAEVKERFLNAGFEVEASSPEELTVKLKSEMVKWGKVLKDAGIRNQ